MTKKNLKHSKSNITNDYYYDIAKDLDKYNDAWCFLVVGGRNTGKTYGALCHMIDTYSKFVFIKRTMEDVDLLCTSTKNNQYSIDLSPFKSINRDRGTNIRAYKIQKGIGAFYNFNEDNEPHGVPVGYILALSAVQKFKGFDLSECDYIIFDEFIPQKWERVSRNEGNLLLDLYKTVSRDREHRGKDPLKLLCLANAVNISNPTTNTLEVTDIMAQMNNSHIEEYFQDDRGIYIRMLKASEDFFETEKNSQIFKAMGNTEWGRMALQNEFAYDDFSNVGNISLKHFKGYVSFKYKSKNIYVYLKDGIYYFTHSKYKEDIDFDLSKENDQKRFWKEYIFDLRNECIDGKCVFQTYTMYDIVVNYKSLFRI